MSKKQSKKAPKMVTVQIPETLRNDVRRLVDDEKREREELAAPLDRKKLAINPTALGAIRHAVKELHRLIKPVEKQAKYLQDIDRALSRKDEDWITDQIDEVYEVNQLISDLQIDV